MYQYTVDAAVVRTAVAMSASFEFMQYGCLYRSTYVNRVNISSVLHYAGGVETDR